MATTTVKLTRTQADQPLLHACAQTLEAGELAIVPMETVYGILARADHPQALERLRRLREPEPRRPLTLHVADPAQARQYIDPPTPYAWHLMRKLWPGPVGLMFSVSADRRKEVAGAVGVAEHDLFDHDLIILRCPSHPAAREILRACQHPVVAIVPPDGANSLDRLPAHILVQAAIALDDGDSRYGKPSTIVKVKADHFDIVRRGVYDRRIIEKMLRTTILFVCSGNTCRSPMAEAITRKVLADHLKVHPSQLEQAGYVIRSAGTVAFAGAPATPNAVEAVRAIGADLLGHRSQPLTQELIQQADMIFAMGQGHLQAIRQMLPAAIVKSSTLDPKGDIDDPIGGDLGLYRSLAAEIFSIIQQRLADRSLLGTEMGQ